MNTVLRKIFRDLTARWWRTALIALSVFMGVLGVVSISTMGGAVSRQLERDLVPGEMAMLRVYVESVPGSTIDNQAVIDRLRALPDVVAVEGQAIYVAEWRRAGDETFRQGDLFAYSEPYGAIRLEGPRLLSGRFPQPGGQEIAVERRMAGDSDLHAGDSIDLRAPGGTPVTFTITGIVFQPYLVLGSGGPQLYAAYDDAQRLLSFSGFSSFYARYTRFADALQQSAEFRRALEQHTPYRSVYYVRTDPDRNPFLVSVRQFVRVLSLLSVLLLTVACLLVANMIHVMVARQHAQIGAMKALGATRSTILRIYLGLAFSYGVIGTVPGVILGVVLGRRAAYWLAPLANTYLQDPPVSWTAVAMGMGLGLLIPVLTAVAPALHASRVTILVAMADPGMKTDYGAGLLPRLVRRLQLPLPLMQVVNRIVHHKIRLALTFAALMAACAAFMALLAVVDSLDDVLTYVDEQLGRKVAVTLNSADIAGLGQSLFMGETTGEIKPGTAIELVVPLQDGEDPLPDRGLAADTRHLPVLGVDPATDLAYLESSGSGPITGDLGAGGLLLSASVAEDYGLAVGDTLTLQSPNRTESFPITGIVDFPLQIGFMGWQQLRDFVGEIRGAPVPNAYWERVRLAPDEGDLHLWAVGIDERAAGLIAPNFDPDEPGVILSRAAAAEGGWEVGDRVELAPGQGGTSLALLRATDVMTLPVMAVIDLDPAQLAMFAESLPEDVDRADPAVVGLPWWTLAELTGLDYDEAVPDTYEIDLLNPALNGTASTHAVFRNQDSFSNRVAQTMIGVSGVMGAGAVLMALVGGTGLLTIMSVNVFERRREIGLLRSVGATSSSILSQFLLEGLLIGLGAWAAALPLSYLIGRSLVHSVPFGDLVFFRFAWFVPVVGLGGMVVVTTLATLYPSILAARQRIGDILRYK